MWGVGGVCIDLEDGYRDTMCRGLLTLSSDV